jgi:hypothetical protein
VIADLQASGPTSLRAIASALSDRDTIPTFAPFLAFQLSFLSGKSKITLGDRTYPSVNGSRIVSPFHCFFVVGTICLSQQ